MKLFITGATGFSGRYLIDEFLNNTQEKIEIFGLTRGSQYPNPDKRCRYVEGNLLSSPKKIALLLEEIQPDLIVHLAGLNRGNLPDLLNSNVVGTERLLEAVLLSGLSPRILIVGSSAEYGYIGKRRINENTPIKPLSEYGISKAAASMLASMYFRKYKLKICIAKPFNIVGPGQSEDYFCGNLISKFFAYENGEINSIELINSESRRDYVDVRDVVRAYRNILCHPDFMKICDGKIFNIGSGSSYSVFETFRIVEQIMRKKFKYHIRPSTQPDCIPSQVCDCNRIKENIGWQPQFSYIDSIEDMIKEKSKKIY